MAKKKAKPDFSKPKPASSMPKKSKDGKRSESIEMSKVTESNEEISDDVEVIAEFEDEFYEYENGMAKKRYEGLPLVVIAGRPNVGKSTLFNRFMQRRLAIVDPTPGVTRDPVEGTAIINGKPVHLIDTGGYKLQRNRGTMEAVLDELVVQRSLEMIQSADVILLLLEAGQITGEDEEFIQELRPYWNKVVAAVNKTEGGREQSVSWNYAQFGFKELFFISASHGDNIGQLADFLVSQLDFSRVSEVSEDEVPIRIAIMGKPNTGKSTLTNRLTHSNASIVSDYAGTTRDTVEGEFSFGGRKCIVLDTAGIRRKARVSENVEYYSVNRAIKTLDRCDVVFLMIDSQEGLAEQDKKICSLAYERGRGIIFVLNKWDTQEDQSRKTFKKTKEWINIMFGKMDYAPILPLSALHGKGIKDLLKETLEIYKQLNRTVETASLNLALKDWLFRYPPPASKTAHFKIRYITQVSTNPVKFLIFATRPEVVPDTYITYLMNRIRDDLGFEKIPVQLEMKASRKKWEDRFER